MSCHISRNHSCPSLNFERRVHGDVILEPERAFVEQHGLVVAHSLARSVEGKTVAQLLNPSPVPVTVQRSTRVGVLRPLVEVC